MVDVAVEELDAGERRGLAAHDAWNNAAVSLIRAAQAHARYLIADCYVRSVSSGEEAATFSAPVRQVLSQLCHLFLLHWLMERSGDFVLVSCRSCCCSLILSWILFLLLLLSFFSFLNSFASVSPLFNSLAV